MFRPIIATAASCLPLPLSAGVVPATAELASPPRPGPGRST
jgi:hypothetical protein